jgi:gentisate 1,2-dioxygenase
MTATARKIDMADMPVQHPSAPIDAAQSRARFFNSGNAFNIRLPSVPAKAFREEAAKALTIESTVLLPCDQSGAIGAPYLATTPLMLTRYAAIAPRDRLKSSFNASGVIWYVIRGAGVANVGPEQFAWAAGDVFLTPGGVEAALQAGPSGAVLWLVTNEPQLAFERAEPTIGEDAAVECVHYSAAEIALQLKRVVEADRNETTSGVALIFSSARGEAARNITPSLTLSLNTVAAGERQRAHRHNSAAITLILEGEAAYSMIGGERCAWTPFATLVTPATAPHSHHNDGGKRAAFLIVQDGGLYYHARTMSFAFLEPEA